MGVMMDARDYEYLKSRIDSTDNQLRDLRDRFDEQIQDIDRLSKKLLKMTNYAVWITGCGMGFCFCCVLIMLGW